MSNCKHKNLEYIKQEIEKRERTIMLLGYDVIGHSASSNVDRMKQLRAEIRNLQDYGTPRPRLAQRLLSALRRHYV